MEKITKSINKTLILIAKEEYKKLIIFLKLNKARKRVQKEMMIVITKRKKKKKLKKKKILTKIKILNLLIKINKHHPKKIYLKIIDSQKCSS